eukprot:305557-Rhodomonas_salina.1
MSGTERGYAATPCPVLSEGMRPGGGGRSGGGGGGLRLRRLRLQPPPVGRLVTWVRHVCSHVCQSRGFVTRPFCAVAKRTRQAVAPGFWFRSGGQIRRMWRSNQEGPWSKRAKGRLSEGKSGHRGGGEEGWSRGERARERSKVGSKR